MGRTDTYIIPSFDRESLIMESTRGMRASLFAVAVLFAAGCQLERLNPGAVGQGVARLTVRNAAVITAVLAEDSTCGFKSKAALESAKVQGTTGQLGTVTWTVTDCTIDFGAQLEALSKDCSGVETSAGGKVVVSATRVVEGMLTGSSVNPVIPNRPDATTVTHTATLTDFVSARTDSPASLKVISGKLSWTALPKLAVSKTKGVCAVATNELGLSGITYEDAELFVDSGSRRFNVPVGTSDLKAQLGRWGDEENALSGTLTVWGGPVELPKDGDKDGLDPAYDAAKFLESYACKDDLATPVDRSCPPLQDRLAQGASQLSVSMFGTIASVIDDDTRCGFASPTVMASARLMGSVGGEGSVTYTISSACVQQWAQATAAKTDCHMLERRLQGKVSVTGTKTVRGLLTGDPAAPVVPTSRDAAKVVLTMTFENLTSTDSASTSGLTVESGTLTGELGSRLALDTTSGACSIKTPVVYFRSLSWANAKVQVHSDGAQYPLTLGASKLDAQAGPREDHTNWLEGTLTVDGTARQIPVKGPPILDPSYEAAHHLASYACLPNIKVPQNDEQCSFKEALAKNVARLVVQTAGTVASMVNKDTSCGFDGTLKKLNPDEVIGEAGEIGSMTWSVSRCELAPRGDAQVDQGCTGGRRYASGRSTVSGSRKVVGERETRLLVVASIIPRTRDAVTLDLSDIQLSDFAAWSIAPGQSAPAGKLTIHAGRLTTYMKPILGELASDPGRFEIPTPVAQFDRITLTGARATLQAGAKVFSLELPEVTLAAQNGSFRGKSNVVSGRVKIGTTLVELPEMPLDPGFMQAAFDSTYACTADLRGVIPPN